MTVLNTADAVKLGAQTVDKVYLGPSLVWPTVAAWTPASISGLKVWFDASQLPGADGSAVSPWPNLGNPSVPGTIVGTPSPVVAVGGKNGLKTVRFSLNEGRVRITSGSGINLEWTLVYVGRMRTGNFGRVLDAIYPPNNLLVGWWNGYEDVMYDAGFVSPDVKISVDTSWRMYSGDGTAGLSRLFSDGTLLGTTTTAAGWGGTFAISGYEADFTQESCDCEIAEVVMYDHKLSDTDRATVEGYLRTKWGM